MHSSQIRRGRVRQIFIVLFCGTLLITGALWVRSRLLAKSISDSLLALRAISAALPRTPSMNESGTEFSPLLPIWPRRSAEASTPEMQGERPQEDVEPSQAKRMRTHRRVKRRKSAAATVPLPPIGPYPRNVRAPAALVLAWAEAGVVPQGIVRAATDTMPAGIELRGVGALAIGLLDGDRLLSVNGSPVEDRGQVLQAILAARASGAQTMRAGLVRLTQEGPQNFVVVVEQPYLELPSTPSSEQLPASGPL